MKRYSFIEEFSGNCAAAITGVETLAKTPKTLTSYSMGTLLKKQKRLRRGSTIKKSDTGVKSLVR